MDRIQLQASKLWDLLFSEDTASTYQNALNLTGTILKESAQLIWLVICSVFVFGAWVGDTSVKTGQGIRTWVDKQGSEESTPDPAAMADKSKALLESGRKTVANLLNQAREQLGMEAAAPAQIKPAASQPATTKPAAKAPVTAAPAAAVKPAAAATGETVREAVEDDWPPRTED